MRKYDIYIETHKKNERYNSIVDIARFLKIDKRTQEVSLAVAWSGDNVFYSVLGIGNSQSLADNTKQIAPFAILSNADKVAVLHNHPTEIAEASESDLKHLENLRRIFDILEIDLVSDIILSYDGSYVDLIGGKDD